MAPCSGPGDLTPYPVGAPEPENLAIFLNKYPHLSLAKPEVQKVRTFYMGVYSVQDLFFSPAAKFLHFSPPIKYFFIFSPSPL